MKKSYAFKATATAIIIAVTGCSTGPRMSQSSYEKIGDVLKDASENRPAPKPPAQQNVLQSLLPSLAAEVPPPVPEPEHRFDLKVVNAPAPQVLNAIVNDTRFSMVVHPSIKDPISLSLKRVTVQETLNSIREVYGYEYRIEGNLIYVTPAGLQTRLFKVDYLSTQRSGTTDIRVSSNAISDPLSLAGPPAPSTSMQTNSSNNFWGELRTSLAVLAGCSTSEQRSGAPAPTTAVTAAAATQALGAPTALSPITAAAGATLNNPVGRAAIRAEQMLYAPLFCPEGRNIVVSPQAGTVLVRAMPEELKSIVSYLRASQISVERQVLIEAKILEVALKDGYDTGINWAAFFRGVGGVGQLTPGTTIGNTGSGALVGGTPATGAPSTPLTAAAIAGGILGLGGTALTSGVGAAGSLFGVAIQAQNFAALMTFLQSQGVVHTLSSPRIATMNNQKAVLKVGSDALYITKITGGSLNVSAGTTSQTAPTFESQSFFSGLALDVTPQIGDDGNILLHVRPSVSNVSQQLTTLNLGALGTFTIPLVTNTISETDSVIRAQDTQIVAIGGLMRTAQSENRGQVPGLGDIPFAGGLFRSTQQASEKRELVILIKPTIIQADETWARDILNTRDRVQNMRRGFSWGGRAEVFGTEAEGDRR